MNQSVTTGLVRPHTWRFPWGGYVAIALMVVAGGVVFALAQADGSLVLAHEDFKSGGAGFKTVLGGIWQVMGGQYRLAVPAPRNDQRPGLANQAIHAVGADGNFTVQADFIAPAVSAGAGDAALIYDWQDAQNYQYADFSTSGDPSANGLFRMSGGKQTKLTGFAAAFAPNISHHVVVMRHGDVFRAAVDGVVVGSATDATFDSARFGLGSRDNAVTFDNFVVAHPEAIPPTAPRAVVQTAVTTQTVTVSWGLSTDNVATAGYRVFCNGTLVATVGAPPAVVTHLSPNTDYRVEVAAVDADNNLSAKSAPVMVKTASVPLPSPVPGKTVHPAALGAATGPAGLGRAATDAVRP